MGTTAYVAERDEGADWANGADRTNGANLAKICNLALHKNTLFYFDTFCHQDIMGSLLSLGKDGCANSDEFSTKFQAAFDPPSFSENYVAIFYNGYGRI